MRSAFGSLLVTLTALLASLGLGAGAQEIPLPYTSLNFERDPARFQFAIVSDRNGGYREGVFAKAVAQLNQLEPQFVMCVGDLIEGYSEQPSEIEAMYNRLDKELAELKRPFIFVPGNHDLSNNVGIELYRKHRGSLYHQFVYRDVLFLCLDSEDPPEGHIGDEQVAFIKDTLEKNPAARWTMVFMHHPLWTEGPEKNGWAKVEDLLKGRPYTVFAGHTHQYCKYVRDGQAYYVLPTTGGGSDLYGADFGLFDSITWVTMTDEGPKLTNLAMNGILPDDVLAESRMGTMNAVIGAAPRVMPLLLDEDTFTTGSVTARLTNPLDVPMHVRIVIPQSHELKADPDLVDADLPPSSSRSVDIMLKAAGAVSLANPMSLDAECRMSFQWPDRKQPRTLESACRVAVDRLLPCPSSAEPATVDGALNEWGELPYRHEPAQLDVAKTASPQGTAKFSFATRHDDRFVYFGVHVVDSEIVATPGSFPLDQDAVAVLLDARPDPVRSLCRDALDLDNAFLVLAMSPGETRDQVYGHEELPREIEMACVRTDDGYTVEYAVPMAVLDKFQRGPWESMRVNVAVNDKRKDGVAQAWWRPAWNTPANTPGSGTFRRR